MGRRGMDSMIVIDSNIWIFSEIKDAPEHSKAIRAVADAVGREQVGINPVILSETYHMLCKYYQRSQVGQRLSVILDHPSVEWLTLQRGTCSVAMKLSAQAGIRINDAMIAQQALDMKASVLTDDVRDFRKVKGLKIIPLR